MGSGTVSAGCRARYGRCARWWLVDGGPGVHVFLFGAGHHDGGPRVTGQSVEWVKLTRRSKPGESAVTRTREGERVSCKLSNSTLTDMYGFTLYMRYVTTCKPEAEHTAQSPPYSGTAFITRTGHPTVPLPAARQIVHKARRPRAIMEPRESARAWSLCRKQCRVSLGYTAFVPRSTLYHGTHGQTRDTDRSDRDCGALPYTTTAQRAFLPS